MRVEFVDEQNAVNPKLITHSVRTMEFRTACTEECAEQGVNAVRVVILILRMLSQGTI